VQAGGVFVDRAARTLVEAKLAGSKLAGADTIESIISIFEEKTKRRFTGSGEASIIKFGTSQETDRHIGVNMGRLTLSSWAPFPIHVVLVKATADGDLSVMN
jgi:hypothetical protein